jgi:large subunit ribosomal protein L14e
MPVPRGLPDVGRVVEVVQGRDNGLYAVVIGHADKRFVLIADGQMRRAENPKKKNVLHVRGTSYVALEVVEALRTKGKITNALLKHALRLFQEALPSVSKREKEGGVPNG